MRSPEGIDYWRHGVYRAIVEPERLVFTYISDDPASNPEHETIVTMSVIRDRLAFYPNKVDRIDSSGD